MTSAQPNWKNRTLFHGDNLMFLRAMNSSSVDLIATDPPFNKGKDFHATPDSLASGARFQDRWTWKDDVHQEWIDTIKDDHPQLWAAIITAGFTHSEAMKAFCCFMGVRLLAMHRILKPSGSIYVHCDQTANSYIRMVMDAIFGPKNMMNDIIWKRADAKNTASKQFSRDTDNILFYAKDANKSFFNIIRKAGGNVGVDNGKLKVRIDSSGRKFFHHSLRAPTSRPNGMFDYRGVKPPPTGWCMTIEKMDEMYKKDGMELNDKGTEWKRKRYLDEMAGPLVGNCWDDIKRLGPRDGERTGWPTQKPIALYERIIKASCPDGGIVLDPFAGCATTCVAAERLGMQWVGMDLWPEAGDVIADRMKKECGDGTLWRNEVLFTEKPPLRTDDGMVTSVHLKTPMTKWEPEGKKMSRQEMKDHLLAEHGNKCQGCDHSFHDHRHLQLDHNTPKADGGINHISNRILLCGPCNQLKSHLYTLSGLRKENRKLGYMAS